MTNHIVNVTSELRGLRRCFKNRYNVVRGLEKTSYSRDASWDGRMSGTRRLRRGAGRRDIPEEEAASWSQVAGNHGNYMRRKSAWLEEAANWKAKPQKRQTVAGRTTGGCWEWAVSRDEVVVLKSRS